MRLESWVSTLFHPALIAWNIVFCSVAVFLMLTNRIHGWPFLARLGFAFACCGMLADVLIIASSLNSDEFPYWCLKDIGFGLICLSFLVHTRHNDGDSDDLV
jgi:hypothetical protein